MNATKESEKNICGNFEAIYNEFIAKNNETWSELSQKVTDAQYTFQRNQIKEVDPSAVPQNALREFAQAVNDAWDVAQNCYVDAYVKYIDDYKNTWVNVDSVTLSPLEMADITLSANLVAGHAKGTIDNLSLIASLGVPPWIISMIGKECK